MHALMSVDQVTIIDVASEKMMRVRDQKMKLVHDGIEDSHWPE
jgi:hypothetical protein